MFTFTWRSEITVPNFGRLEKGIWQIEPPPITYTLLYYKRMYEAC